MTTIYMVKNGSDKDGNIISLEQLNKCKDNVYNVKADDKIRVGLTPQEIQVMVNSKHYDKLSIKEVYNRAQGLAERVTDLRA